MSTRPSIVARALIGVVRLYQVLISPLLTRVFGRLCRFHPNCSAYAVEALAKKGVLVGSAMAFWRVLRCNPMVPGGYDPVDKGEQGGEEPAAAAHRGADRDRSAEGPGRGPRRRGSGARSGGGNGGPPSR